MNEYLRECFLNAIKVVINDKMLPMDSGAMF